MRRDGDHVELFRRAVEHRLGRADFLLANGRRRLDVHDHRMLQIYEGSCPSRRKPAIELAEAA